MVLGVYPWGEPQLQLLDYLENFAMDKHSSLLVRKSALSIFVILTLVNKTGANLFNKFFVTNGAGK
jgi:hypothetical protein